MSLVALVCAAQTYCANLDSGSIRLTVFPDAALADGRSTLTVTAEVRDSGGNLVPDGTQVFFETSLGLFREQIVTTQNGFARAVILAGSIPGNAKVRASILKLGASSQTDVRFVANKSLLESASEYIEVVSPRDMAYSLEDKILEASGEGQNVRLRYGEITIDADDLQLNVPIYEVRAKNARLKMDGKEYEFADLFMRLNQRQGVGTQRVREVFYTVDRSWYIGVPKGVLRDSIKPVHITAEGVSDSATPVVPAQFEFQDISLALTIIEARKAVCFPSKEVHFHRSNVIVGGQSIMKVPLFKASTMPESPIITEQFVNVSNNDLAINYPYYLDLRPGSTSLFRLRQGSHVGTGVGLANGTYLDFEYNWNDGTKLDGAFSVRGIARNDWGVNLRQFWRPSTKTSLSAQLDFPAHRSMFSNINANQDFEGFSANLNASHGQSFDGDRFKSNQFSTVVEKDPMRLGPVPARLFIGATATQTQFQSPTSTTDRSKYGLRTRLISDPFRLGQGQSLNLSYAFSKYVDSSPGPNTSQQGTLSLSTSFKSGLFLQSNYDYVVDGITDTALGRHRVSTNAYFSRGLFSLRGFASKSLDVQRLSANLSLDYRSSALWRFSYELYSDQYLGDSFLDQTVVVAYKIGFREVGLSYSHRRQRLGLEILGTTFN